ncbi:DoxX family protein [Amycolatopsis sp. NPDC004368]
MTFSTLVSLPPSRYLRPVVPLFVRLVAGTVMIGHGTHFTPAAFGEVVRQHFGLPLSGLIGWAVTLLMFIGGGLVILGLFTRIVAVPSIVHLTLGALLIDSAEGFAPREGGGMQIPLMLVAALLVLLATGPGRLSLDNAFGWDNGWPRTRTEPVDA